MSNEKAFLKVEDLVIEYTSSGQVIHAVNGVSFSLDKGSTIGLVGETGAGKTSIAKAIIGVLRQPPARIPSGKIYLEGRELISMSAEEKLEIQGNRISMIFQDPMTALNPVIPIGEQIAEVIGLHENLQGKHEAKEKALEVLKMVGISQERYGDFPHQFSGGMKQRVVIAIALACNPELLLADEPTTALDVTIQAQILEMISELRRKLGTSMILITHDLGVVAEMCDDVAVVYAGEIVEMGTVAQVFRSPAHPYTNGLFGSLPVMARGQKRLNSIPGAMPDPTDLPQGCAFHPRCPHATEACRSARPALVDIGGGHLCRCARNGEV